MDEAFVSSCDISLNKAWSAQPEARYLMKLTCQRPARTILYGLQLTNQQRIILFWRRPGQLFLTEAIGAVGVSGGTVEFNY